jgi:hypothetical protein
MAAGLRLRQTKRALCPLGGRSSLSKFAAPLTGHATTSGARSWLDDTMGFEHADLGHPMRLPPKIFLQKKCRCSSLIFARAVTLRSGDR